MPSIKKIFLAGLAVATLMSQTQCGFKQLATKASTDIFYDATPSIDSESDVDLARDSSLAFLKMLEGFYRQNPKDKKVLFLLTKAYAGFAFGFTENDVLANKGGDKAAYDKATLRAKLFYTRARDYGMQLLSLNSRFNAAKEGTLDEFKSALKTFGQRDIENLFWTGFAWANYVNYNKDSVEAVGDLPRIQAIFERALEIDENYYFGGPHLFLGAFYGSRPKILGGDPDKSREEFEKAIAISGGKYLMGPVTEAQFYAVQVQDAALYQKLLEGVLAADAAALPEQRLSNELAKIRAKTLLDKKSLFFNTGTPTKVEKKKKTAQPAKS